MESDLFLDLPRKVVRKVRVRVRFVPAPAYVVTGSA